MQQDDMIGLTARQYLDVHGPRARDQIEARIADAEGRRDWDEMNRWHRVRLRALRLQRFF